MNLSAMYAWNYFQLAQEFMWMLGNNHTYVDGNAVQIEQVSHAVNKSKEAVKETTTEGIKTEARQWIVEEV